MKSMLSKSLNTISISKRGVTESEILEKLEESGVDCEKIEIKSLELQQSMT